jgi:hypothetical protein
MLILLIFTGSYLNHLVIVVFEHEKVNLKLLSGL